MGQCNPFIGDYNKVFAIIMKISIIWQIRYSNVNKMAAGFYVLQSSLAPQSCHFYTTNYVSCGEIYSKIE